jgi:hypothetical protein
MNLTKFCRFKSLKKTRLASAISEPSICEGGGNTWWLLGLQKVGNTFYVLLSDGGGYFGKKNFYFLFFVIVWPTKIPKPFSVSEHEN